MPQDDIDYFKSIKEPDDIDNMKYQEGISFTFEFDIIDYRVSRNSTHTFSLKYNQNDVEITLDNLMVVNFKGQTEIGNLIISDDLIYGNFDAQKSGGKQYFYFYIDGHFEYYKVLDNVWLSRKDYLAIAEKHPKP